MNSKLRFYLWLAKINLFISAFTFGGGYIVVPMVRKYFVEKKKLFNEEELIEMAAIAQSTPGAIAVNLMALSGYRTGGSTGMLISCVCAVLPPLAILGAVSLCYSAIIANTAVAAVLKGMQACVAALIVDFVADMTGVVLKEHSLFSTALVLTAFLISFFTSINVILVLFGSCILCILQVYASGKGGR